MCCYPSLLPSLKALIFSHQNEVDFMILKNQFYLIFSLFLWSTYNYVWKVNFGFSHLLWHWKRLSCYSIEKLCLFIILSSGLYTVLQMWPYWYWVERKSHLPWPDGNTFSNAAEDAASLLCGKVWLMFKMVPIWIPRSLSENLLSICYSSSSAGLHNSPCCTS